MPQMLALEGFCNLYASFFYRVLGAFAWALRMALVPVRIALSTAVRLMLHIVNHRETVAGRRHLGTVAAAIVGVLIAGLAVVSSFQTPKGLPGSGDLLLRGVLVAILGQMAMHTMSLVWALPGWRRSRRQAVAKSLVSRLAGASRVGFSNLSWGGYAAAQLLDKLRGGHHAALVSLLFLCFSPFLWFTTDLVETWRRFDRSRSNGRSVVLMEGFLGIAVGILLLAGVAIMILAVGPVVTVPVIIAAVAGACQAPKILAQRLVSREGVDDSAALANQAFGSLLINSFAAAFLVFVIHVYVAPGGLWLIAWALCLGGFLGALRQKFEQYSFRPPRKMSGVALMTLSAPLAQYLLSGWILGQWGTWMQVAGEVILVMACLSYTVLGELLLRF